MSYATGILLDENSAELTKDGRLCLPRCGRCQRFHYPMREICPHCWADKFIWVPVSGEGVVETFLWYHARIDPRAPEPPYNIALIRLAEGPGLLATLASVEPGQLRIGTRVEAHIVQDGEAMRPDFRLCPETETGVASRYDHLDII